jgi:dihydroorotate dehydrogenase (fumarate)
MASLETTYAGLKLRNPIIVSSSGLTDSPEKNKKLYEAGAGAIVLKSLFEEQVMKDADWQGDMGSYAEGSDYLVEFMRENQLGEFGTNQRNQKSMPDPGYCKHELLSRHRMGECGQANRSCRSRCH